MFAVILAAVFGAGLGLLMRNRVLAVAVAVFATGLTQLGAMFVVEAMGHNEQYAILSQQLSGYVGTDYWSVAPTVAAGGAGCLLSAFMIMLMRLDKAETVSLPGQSLEMPRARDRNGKLRRAPGMIEDRPIHEAAESRIDRLMKL